MSVFKLSPKQTLFVLTKQVKVGSIHMLPTYGFNVYSDSNGSKMQFIDANPFTKSLANVLVKVVEYDKDYVKLSVINSKKPLPDFWVKKIDMEMRDVSAWLFLTVVCYIPFVIYNIFSFV